MLQYIGLIKNTIKMFYAFANCQLFDFINNERMVSAMVICSVCAIIKYTVLEMNVL